ncbi:MAG TPA: hypothetical protein VNJ08_13335 [Bacteriovoracaceae bacterium]|nr:hypothetical protein [Bacteriovoracaceae bacterium]
MAELAKLRWIEGWTRPQLAEHYKKTFYAIAKYCVTIKKKKFKLEGLSIDDRKHLMQRALESKQRLSKAQD